ncbi:MAG: sugar transferase, partial [Pseudomonadota bacterium]
FANIIPAFMTSYGLVLACFFFLRLDYSRAQFGTSFLLVVICFMGIAFILSRYRRAEFVLVTDKPLSNFRRVRGIDWIRAPDRVTATRYRHLPLAVDFQSDTVDADWERYLAEEAIAGRLVYDRRQVVETLEGRVTIKHLSENSFGHLAPDSIYAPAKRYIDIVCALIALVLFAPIMLVLAILIRLDSRGPALFRQSRMGYRGKPFTVFKFRSMQELPLGDASRVSDMTANDDDRITRIGRFIRRTRLDELPQIFNILRGEMSWIGPRPETLRLSHWYEGELPFYRYRHIVRPGITGWAQVNQGHVTSVDDVREKLEYDFYYVKYFSLWTDILIAIKTIGVVLTGHGSK